MLSSGFVALDYFHKNSERDVSVVIQILTPQFNFLMAWVSYLILSLNNNI